MVRIRYSAVLRFFAICFFVLFIIPSLLKLLNGPGETDPKSQSIQGHGKEPIIEDFRKDTRDINLENGAIFKEGVIGNYEEINPEKREGPGEGGVGVNTEPEARGRADATVREFGFNMYASDKISLDRRIKDTRPAECKYWHYPELSKLPTASVVIVFVNEGWSTLMRTVHSVINTTPPELLAEIVLVDDFSNKVHLKEKLENYIKRFKGKVVLHRTTKREGLVQARVIGAEKSTGEVIVILDAHCECVTNWLPPLLTRIAVNRKILAVPIVDGIDWNTLEHTNIYGKVLKRGIWEWGFLYKEANVPEKELHTRKSEPYW